MSLLALLLLVSVQISFLRGARISRVHSKSGPLLSKPEDDLGEPEVPREPEAAVRGPKVMGLAQAPTKALVPKLQSRDGHTLVMSDVDDTATCPAYGRGDSWVHDKKAEWAGIDTCIGEITMEHGEIYYGYGLFLYLLGSFSTDQMRYVIVSANPWGTINYYSNIRDYVKQVSESCSPRMSAKGKQPVSLNLDRVRQGTSTSSLRGHAYMAIRKLSSMLKEVEQTNPAKVVWIGDTGQGDVCAGVCFINPVLCAQAMPLWVHILKTTRQVHWPRAVNWVVSGGTSLPVTSFRFAFFHEVTDELKSADPVLDQCLTAAKELESQKKVAFFGIRDPGNRAADYRDAMNKAVSMRLMEAELVRSFWKNGGEDSYDCMTARVYGKGEIYKKKKKRDKKSKRTKGDGIEDSAMSGPMGLDGEAEDEDLAEPNITELILDMDERIGGEMPPARKRSSMWTADELAELLGTNESS